MHSGSTMLSSKHEHGHVSPLLYIKVTLLLFLGSSASVANGIFLSIDCGGSESYTDDNNIRWVGDDEYVHSGESQSVGNVKPRVVSTVRVFSSLNKNCYTIPVTVGDRILVRASFYYGNFDGADSPPIFDLYFDATYWSKVNITGYSSYINNYEVIYAVKKNTTSICLAQTLPNQFPFISSLELRSLGPDMYTRLGSSYALFNVQRFAFGAYQSTIRYPEDPYDRKWYSAYGLFAHNVRGEAEIPKIDVTGAEDYPPAAVLQNASTVNSTTSYIQLETYLQNTTPVPIYITTFFSEVVQFTSSIYKRSFQIYVDDEPYSKVIVPPFGGVVEVAITNITASSKTSITLRPTSDANLPVLINAFEVYTVSELLSPGTDTRDLEGLAVLQQQFEVLIKWSGDPCLPSKKSQWEWVQCSTGAIPRIISLNLSSFSLDGALPDFSAMDALVTIDLHDNGLEGPIPEFLGSFPYLEELDLSNNRFNGTVPTSLSKNKNLKLVVTGNCLSGMSCPPPSPLPPQVTPPEAPSTTPLSGGSDKASPPPSPNEFQFYSTSTATNKPAAQLLLLLLMLVLETIISALF